MSKPKEKKQLVVKDKREKVNKDEEVVGFDLTKFDLDEYDEVDIEMDVKENSGKIVGFKF